MRSSRLLVRFAGIFLACIGLSRAQSADCLERTLIVNVTDRAFQPTDLSRQNFQVTYRGHSLTPESVYYTEGPRRVMVLLDVSGSMNDRGNFAKWKIARLAALDLVRTMPPGSKVGLITIATKNKTQFPLSSDRQVIADWLEREEARGLDVLGGRTALYDAIAAAITQLQPHEPGDAIYVIGDGGENASASRRAEVEKALRESQVRLFTLILPPNVTYAAVEVTGGRELASLSNNSGGFVETLGLPPGLRIVSEQLKQEIRLHTVRLALQISAFYSLTLKLPEDPQKTRHWEVSVVDSGRRQKNARVDYPHEAPLCHIPVAQK